MDNECRKLRCANHAMLCFRSRVLLKLQVSLQTHWLVLHACYIYQAASSVRPEMEAKRFPSSYVFDLLQFTHVACGL